jgi:hypothetical protein
LGRKLVPGVNDLATLYPEVAREADGWDPSGVTSKTGKKLQWRCRNNHTWEATVLNRTFNDSGCPYCSGQRAIAGQASVGDRTPPRNSGCPFCSGREVLVGVNDLATLFPDLAAEVVQGDPRAVTAKSNKTFLWRCKEGHQWEAAVQNRTPPASTGCPECSDRGFKSSQPAWFYLLERPGEQQIGITNRKGL